MPERPLPKKRRGETHEILVHSKIQGRFKVYIRLGFYEDGAIGEVFIDAAKMGSELRGMLNCYAIMFSIALQNGVPPERLIRSFSYMRFEPCGAVDSGIPGLVECTSIPDLVCRVIASYLKQEIPPVPDVA